MLTWRSILAAGVVAAATLGAAAQQPAGVVPEALPTLSVEFGGGTVNQYIAALKKAAPGVAVNAIVSEEAGQKPLPAITLKSVTVLTALSAIESAAGRHEGNWKIYQIADGPAFSGQGGVAYAVAVDFLANDRGGRMLQVYSIQQVVEGPGAVKPEVLLTAIEAALKLDGGGKSTADVMFHDDSGLVIVRGTGSQLRSVQQVIETLRDDVARRGADVSRTKQVNARHEADVKQAEVRVRLAESQMSFASDSAADAETRVKAGAMSRGELLQLQQNVQQARAEFEMARIELERAQAEMAAGPAGSMGGGEAAQLRDIIAQLQAEVQALRKELGERGGGGR